MAMSSGSVLRGFLFSLCFLLIAVSHLSRERRKTFDLLLASDEFYMSTKHRGGWKAIVDELAANGFIQKDLLDESHLALLLVDSIESWFMWDHFGEIRSPWIGFAHLLPKKVLPAHLWKFEGLSLDDYLNLSDFRKSLPLCQALVVFSFETSLIVSTYLRLNGFSNVSVCTVRHPLAVGNTGSPYNPTRDIAEATSDLSAIVLLGQQYRRIATLHVLKTKRQKVWMASYTDKALVIERTKVELEAEGAVCDESIQIRRVESCSSFDRILRANIIIVDVWAAGANNAVLEAVALNIPIFIRKVPGVVEYVGDKYPLFFKSTDELQNLIDDKENLGQLFLLGHNYLRVMDKRHLSISSFQESIQSCLSSPMEAVPKMSTRS